MNKPTESMEQESWEDKFEQYFGTRGNVFRNESGLRFYYDDIKAFIHKVRQQLLGEIREIIKHNTDPLLGTTDYDGIAKEVISFVQENGKR